MIDINSSIVSLSRCLSPFTLIRPPPPPVTPPPLYPQDLGTRALLATKDDRLTEAQTLKSEQEDLRRTCPLSEEAVAERAAVLRRLLDRRVDEVSG